MRIGPFFVEFMLEKKKNIESCGDIMNEYVICTVCKICISSSVWNCKIVIVCCIAVIGLLYPYLDDILGEKRGHKQEWSSVMRCVAVFVGINHASAVSFTNSSQSFLERQFFIFV